MQRCNVRIHYCLFVRRARTMSQRSARTYATDTEARHPTHAQLCIVASGQLILKVNSFVT